MRRKYTVRWWRCGNCHHTGLGNPALCPVCGSGSELVCSIDEYRDSWGRVVVAVVTGMVLVAAITEGLIWLLVR